ncbi:MAG: hypothetical protein IJ049_06270 [Oscillospiraceae bacterium]|nr:hypothetical protein [Oscillospiraceae bacterium]
MNIYTEIDTRNLPDGFYLVSADELDNLLSAHSTMEADFLAVVDHIDLLTDCYRELVHLNQTISGIVGAAEGLLDAHRLRTVKGMRRKADKLTQQVLDICDSADAELDEMALRWPFIDGVDSETADEDDV